jgi:hypothetical protein
MTEIWPNIIQVIEATQNLPTPTVSFAALRACLNIQLLFFGHISGKKQPYQALFSHNLDK